MRFLGLRLTVGNLGYVFFYDEQRGQKRLSTKALIEELGFVWVPTKLHMDPFFSD
jgi:hypothetical protein